MWHASLEAGMLELGRCRGAFLTDLAEAVEVKLSHERRPVAVSVHRRDDLPGEGLGVVDHKGVAVLRPAADLSRARADQSVGLCHSGDSHGMTGEVAPCEGISAGLRSRREVRSSLSPEPDRGFSCEGRTCLH